MINIPSCTSCGACCCHHDPKWIEVSADDARSIPVELLQAGDIEQFSMKMNEERCVALAGSMGVLTHCKIYGCRPNICRKVEPGSQICLYMLGYHWIDVGLER